MTRTRREVEVWSPGFSARKAAQPKGCTPNYPAGGIGEGGKSGNPMEPVEARIAARAYEIYESPGRQDGSALEDWLEAEQEILSTSSHPGTEIVAELSRVGRHGCRSRPPSLPASGSRFTKTWRNHESRIAPQAVAFGHTLGLAIRRRSNCAKTSERHS